MKYVNFTWKEFDDAMDIIVNTIHPLRRYYKRSDFANIYGVPRGGLVLAVALSHRLNLPLADCVRDDTLVVDDISETGRTLSPYKNHFIAVIHYVEGSAIKPSLYVSTKSKDEWIIYPWETKASSIGGYDVK